MTVKQIMSRHIITVTMDDSLLAVRDLFHEHHFHHLLVTDNGRLVGVVSDRDLLMNISPFADHAAERAIDAATLKRRVHQIMTRKPVTIAPDAPVAEAAALLLDRRVSCLPVVNDQGHPVGILTWRDVLRSVLSPAPADPSVPVAVERN